MHYTLALLSVLAGGLITCTRSQEHSDIPSAPDKAPHHSVVTLNSDTLALFDGVPHLIDKYAIKDIVYIGKEITKLQEGGLDKIGKYSYNNKKYTLKQLSKLEEQHSHANLKPLFEQAVQDFSAITSPFLAKAQGIKSLMIKLIDDWAHKAHRLNSNLRKWSNIDDLKHTIKTIRQLDALCDDLRKFLLSLIKSCPKAWQSYKESFN